MVVFDLGGSPCGDGETIFEPKFCQKRKRCAHQIDARARVTPAAGHTGTGGISSISDVSYQPVVPSSWRTS